MILGYKKGAMNECDNYRGIALLSLPGYVHVRIILNRITSQTELMLRENQRGFWKAEDE